MEFAIVFVESFACCCVQAIELCTTALNAASVRLMAIREKRIGIDCEGCNLSRTGQLCLLQVVLGFLTFHIKLEVASCTHVSYCKMFAVCNRCYTIGIRA